MYDRINYEEFDKNKVAPFTYLYENDNYGKYNNKLYFSYNDSMDIDQIYVKEESQQEGVLTEFLNMLRDNNIKFKVKYPNFYVFKSLCLDELFSVVNFKCSREIIDELVDKHMYGHIFMLYNSFKNEVLDITDDSYIRSKVFEYVWRFYND